MVCFRFIERKGADWFFAYWIVLGCWIGETRSHVVFIKILKDLRTSTAILKERGSYLNQPEMTGYKCTGDRNRQTNGWTNKRPRYQSDFVQDVSEIWMTRWIRDRLVQEELVVHLRSPAAANSFYQSYWHITPIKHAVKIATTTWTSRRICCWHFWSKIM